MPATIRFTKRALEALPPAPAGKRDIYVDDKAAGLELRVTATGAKTFSLLRRVRGGKLERVTLGRFPIVTVEQARKAADAARVVQSEGKSVNAKRKAEQAQSVTLAEAHAAYMTARGDRLKPNTRSMYAGVMDRHLHDWRNKPITKITWDMVRRRHRKLSETSPTSANQVMRVLRAVLNHAMGEYREDDGSPVLKENPVRALSHDRAWNKEARRQGCIEPHHLPAWWQAVEALDETARDYLQLVLLTGLRRREATGLRWEHIDLEARRLIVPATKNGTPHALPLSDYLHDMLKRRQQTAAGPGRPDPWVFPSASSKSGHIEEPKKYLTRVAEAGAVKVSVHDLRRTFITVAERMDISHYALKNLLNHKTGADVTAGYIIVDVERLRDPMQRVTDFILRAAGVKSSAAVVDIRNKAEAL